MRATRIRTGGTSEKERTTNVALFYFFLLGLCYNMCNLYKSVWNLVA